MSGKWTDREKEIVAIMYPIGGYRAVQECLKKNGFANRDKFLIRNFTSWHGIKAPLKTLWSDEEIQILKEWYPEYGYKKVIEELNKIGVVRTQVQIHRVTNRYAIKRILPSGSVDQNKRKKNVSRNTQKRYWTSEEEQILRDRYSELGVRVQLLLPGRSVGQIMNKAKSMELKKMVKEVTWTERDDAMLKLYYSKDGYQCISLFKGKQISDLKKRVRELGLHYEKTGRKEETVNEKIEDKKVISKVIWAKGELEILSKNYPKMGMGVKHLLPNKTANQIRKKKIDLNLKCTAGTSSLTFPLKPEDCMSHYFVAIGRIRKDTSVEDESKFYDVFECRYCGTKKDFPVWIESHCGYTNNL